MLLVVRLRWFHHRGSNAIVAMGAGKRLEDGHEVDTEQTGELPDRDRPTARDKRQPGQTNGGINNASYRRPNPGNVIGILCHAKGEVAHGVYDRILKNGFRALAGM